MWSNFRQTRIQKRDKKEIHIFRGFMIFFVLVGIAIYVALGYIKSVADYEIPAKDYTIKKGINLSNMNEKFDFWIDPTRYRMWLKMYAPEKVSLNVWTYRISTGTTLTQFFTEEMKKPIHDDQTITILPWWNRYDIDAYLAKNEILPAGAFLRETKENLAYYQGKYDFLKWAKSLEGFLMPDTYRIYKNSNAKNIANRLLDGFKNKIAKEYSSLWDNAYKTLILASIVEREERIKENQPIVAGILSKRVREWIPMGADATVCIGYKKTNKECTPEFIGSIINAENPYNTRHTQWYPPTPISSISISAWNAASEPKKSPYYYYLHDNSGQIHYGKTGAEHVANKNKYLR